MEITAKNVGDRTVYHIKKFSNKTVEERILVSQKNKLYLLKSEARKLRIYYQSKYGELCVSSHQTEWEKLKKTLSLVEFGTIQMCTDNYIDKSCRINKAYDYLEDTVREMFSPPSEDGKNSFLSCL